VFGLFLTPVFYVAVRLVVLRLFRRPDPKRVDSTGTQPSPAE
jgi:hydrophobic/amphiphilic exporter-1 (mainly G- bacteria), HAE1 family